MFAVAASVGWCGVVDGWDGWSAVGDGGEVVDGWGLWLEGAAEGVVDGVSAADAGFVVCGGLVESLFGEFAPGAVAAGVAGHARRRLVTVCNCRMDVGFRCGRVGGPVSSGSPTTCRF